MQAHESWGSRCADRVTRLLAPEPKPEPYPERDDDRRVLAAFLRQCDDEHSTCHGILGPGLMFSLLRLASDGFTDDAIVSECAGIRMQDIEGLRRMCDNERAS